MLSQVTYAMAIKEAVMGVRRDCESLTEVDVTIARGVIVALDFSPPKLVWMRRSRFLRSAGVWRGFLRWRFYALCSESRRATWSAG